MARVIYDPRFRPITYMQSVHYGFPRTPRAGQLHWHGGRWWVWHGGGSLGELGFWGVFTKILGAVAPIFGSGGGDKKAQQQTAQSVTEINQKIDAINAKLDQPSGFDALLTKRNLLIAIAGFMAFGMLKGK